MTAAGKMERMSEAEYLAWEAEQAGKHEWLNGEIVAMSGARALHNLLVANLVRALQRGLDGRPCDVLGSDQRVMVADSTMYAYPDLMVVCGQPVLSPTDRMSLTNPTVVVEVLSPSTEAHDRGAKFAHYRQLPSLQAYVLVSTELDRVEVFERDGAEWRFREAGASVRLDCLSLTLSMAEVYWRADLYRAAEAEAAAE
ncbi:MAG: Uma2 family endonuclease [Myxococcales bacterium]|nr:Uma2 family endonuclease [Myxococcales bacterium]MCB9525610.1 Uma2 family endonuclease [Myxococcales bacterium]